MKSFRSKFIIIFAAALVTGVCACSRKSEEASNLPLIKCGFETWMGYSGFYVAEQKGFFEKHGVRVQISRIEAQQDKNAAMARGDIDIMGATLDSSILSKGAGIP